MTVPVVTVLTWVVHEGAHFAAGRALGYGMWMSMNRAGNLDGDYATEAHQMIVTLAGPLVTCAQAALAWGLLRRRPSSVAYQVLFLAFFMRLTALGVSFSNPNDEARASLAPRMPWWALPTVVCLALLGLTVAAARRLGVGWRTNVALYLVVGACAAGVVLGDPYVGRLVVAR